MCPPMLLGLASFAVSAGTQMVGFAAKQQDADAQNAQAAQSWTNALAAGRDEQQQLGARQMQEADAFSQQTHLSLLDEASRKAEAKVAAVDAGVSGLSVDSIVRGIGAKAAANRVTLETNFQNTVAQLQAQKDATNVEIKNRTLPMVAGPNPLGLLFGLAGSGLKAFG